jgi:serine protease Do
MSNALRSCISRFAAAHVGRPIGAALVATSMLAPLSSTWAFAAVAARAADETDSVDRKAVADRVAPSFVIVEILLKQDRGESPNGHGTNAMFEQYIADERPVELPGFLVDATTVVVNDPEIPNRFVKSVRVRQIVGGGSAAVDASPTAWFTEDGGMLLKLAKAIEGTKPLEFLAKGAKPEGAVVSVRAVDAQGVWSLTVGSPEDRFALEFQTKDRVPVQATQPNSISVDAKGRVVAFAISSRRSDSSSSVNDPRQWPTIGADQMASMLVETGKRADSSVLRASLHFRSPRKTQGGAMREMFESDGQVATELETLAVHLADGQLLVLADLVNTTTARLESIEIFDAAGTAHQASFVASLRDWGAFLAKPSTAAAAGSSSLGGGVALSSDDMAGWRNRLMMASSIRIVGRARVSDPMHVRPGGFEVGWRGIRFPTGIVEPSSAYLFTQRGELAAFPIAKREQPGERSRWSRSYGMLTPAAVIAEALRSLDSARDPTNIPLSEEEESRTGWLGVLMQPLDPELARANGAAELTRDGEFGGLVTFVYPDSPAAKNGIEPGMILLSITTPRRQKPIEITLEEMDIGWPGVFPWERLDELPEEYYDQVPAPWPPIEDSLNRTLTELGIGSGYELEFVNNGKTEKKSLTVDLSPPHFNNAPKHEAKEMGLTVRDLTLEIRQYLNLTAEDAGVIVSKLEPGQRASVAGVRPFEIIESVDDVPVKSADEFAKAIAGKTDLRFTVKRAQKERVVKVSLTGSAEPAGKTSPIDFGTPGGTTEGNAGGHGGEAPTSGSEAAR